ncbi:hypothetical protein KSP40_PGU000791 [Platanthera guangdongensis]|uniref:Recombination activating protein 2 n=1 Tax=Platanthera guangdongensis TaxID=2320717 RepID=A0ABR2MDC5_9ASPA
MASLLETWIGHMRALTPDTHLKVCEITHGERTTGRDHTPSETAHARLPSFGRDGSRSARSTLARGQPGGTTSQARRLPRDYILLGETAPGETTFSLGKFNPSSDAGRRDLRGEKQCNDLRQLAGSGSYRGTVSTHRSMVVDGTSSMELMLMDNLHKNNFASGQWLGLAEHTEILDVHEHLHLNSIQRGQFLVPHSSISRTCSSIEIDGTTAVDPLRSKVFLVGKLPVISSLQCLLSRCTPARCPHLSSPAARYPNLCQKHVCQAFFLLPRTLPSPPAVAFCIDCHPRKCVYNPASSTQPRPPRPRLNSSPHRDRALPSSSRQNPAPGKFLFLYSASLLHDEVLGGHECEGCISVINWLPHADLLALALGTSAKTLLLYSTSGDLIHKRMTGSQMWDKSLPSEDDDDCPCGKISFWSWLDL